MKSESDKIDFKNAMKDKYQVSNRQFEVWELIRQGLQDNEIADQLYLSPLTIADHRKALYKGLRKNGNNIIRSKNDATILFVSEWNTYQLEKSIKQTST